MRGALWWGDHDGGDHGGHGDDDNEERRKHCFGSGEFLGDSHYYTDLLFGKAEEKGLEMGLEQAQHRLRAPIVDRGVGFIVKDMIPPYFAYEVLWGAPREACEAMYGRRQASCRINGFFYAAFFMVFGESMLISPLVSV